MDKGLSLEQIIGFLLDAPLFKDLDPDGLTDVVSIMQIQHLDRGSPVFREGDIGDAWFVIYEGTAEVSWEGTFGRHRPTTQMGPRTCFGEMAVLDGSPRSATVTATTELTLLRFPRGAFQELLAEQNLAAYQLVLGMARVLCERQRRLTGEVHGLLEDLDDPQTESRRRMRHLIDAFRVSE